MVTRLSRKTGVMIVLKNDWAAEEKRKTKKGKFSGFK